MKQNKSESFLPASKDQAHYPLFKGIIVHCLVDVPGRDCQVIYAGTEVYGGEYRDTLDDMVTHIVSLGETDEFEKNLEKWNKKGIKVVLPEWFDDCFQLALLCPDDQYLFPNPKVLSLELTDLLSSKVFPPVKEAKPIGNNALFAGKIFYLEQNQPNEESGNPSQQSVNSKLVAAIESFGGKVCQSLAECSTVVIEIQGKLYEEAKCLEKEIGTKRWLRDQIKSQTLLSPLDAVLHYPCPPYQLPEMKNLVITVSNYMGSAREDIFLMANRLGATTTRSMTTTNTHLITACAGGEKFNRAHSWNMHIVNHLWIEEIYAKWSFQREAKPKYVFFPACISQMVNKVRVMERPILVSDKPTAHTASTLVSKAEVSIPEKVVSKPGKEVLSEHQTLAKNIDAQMKEISVKGSDTLKEDFINQTRLEDVNPASERMDGSPQPIIQQVRQEFTITEAIVQNEKELEKNGPLPFESNESIQKTPLQDIRNASGLNNLEEKKRSLLMSSTTLPSPKKLKTDNQMKLRVMFTGIRPVELQKKAMKSLGIIIVDLVAEADLLITHKIARTERFLLAVTKGIPIISLKWVEELSSRKQIPDPDQFPLIDEQAEANYAFHLKDAISLASKKQLFSGYSVYCVGKVEPDSKTIKRLVEAAGGSFKGFLTKKNISMYWKDIAENEASTLCFCSLSDKQTAEDLNMKNVHSTELLLSGLLKQELDWEQYRIF